MRIAVAVAVAITITISISISTTTSNGSVGTRNRTAFPCLYPCLCFFDDLIESLHVPPRLLHAYRCDASA